MKNGIVFIVKKRKNTPTFYMTGDTNKIGRQNIIVFAPNRDYFVPYAGTVKLAPTSDFQAQGMGVWLPSGIVPRLYDPQTMKILEDDTPIVAGAALTAHAVYSIAATHNPKSIVFGADNAFDGCLPVYLAWATSGIVEHIYEPGNVAFRLASLLKTIIARPDSEVQ